MLKGKVIRRRGYALNFSTSPRLVGVYEVTYARGPGEVAPFFEKSRNWHALFLAPTGCSPDLVDLPGLPQVPLQTLRSLAQRACALRRNTDEDEVYITDLVMEGQHYMVADPRLGGFFKMRDLTFKDENGQWPEGFEADEPDSISGAVVPD